MIATACARDATPSASPTPAATTAPPSPTPASPTSTPAPTIAAVASPGCPVPLSELRTLDIPFWGTDGAEHVGQLVVHEDVASEVQSAFRTIRAAKYPITRMRPIVAYGGDDDASMLDNNTSAHNCRRVKGSSRWSAHAYGTAIDINPFKNPWVNDGTVDPPQAARYADRSIDDPQLIHRGDAVWRAFDDIGWTWGGDWQNSKDYQHFSASGR